MVSATTINVIACRWGCTNNDYDFADENEQDISGNYIVPDINKRINKVVSDRINFFEGEDVASLKQLYLKNSQNWFSKTSKKLNFVTNLEEKIQYQAKKESINEFNLLANNKSNFTDFSDLQNQINTTNLGKTYTNVNWDTLINSSTINATEKAEIKDKLVLFYNIFAQIYGKKMFLNFYIE
ncbi:hypothetical protein [Spiroplasma endosymbiont of Apeira syringaria]|uniref:hypothetical protein n=1 Tax=Spiroplasma endosymbiont of Apeira syringaria TaxID=3066307 RepID=UPI0030D2C842